MEYYTRAEQYAQRSGLADVAVCPVAGLVAPDSDGGRDPDYSLVRGEIDWMIKWNLLERYMSRNGVGLSSPQLAMLDLAYHDISRDRGLYYRMAARGWSPELAPISRSSRRSQFPLSRRGPSCGRLHPASAGAAPRLHGRLGTLKLNDQAQRTVLCKDLFRAVDERVERLIEGM